LKKIEYFSRVVLVVCAGIILWLALSPNPPNPGGLFDLDKVNHVAAFFVLSLLADYSYSREEALVSKGLALLSFGMLIEGLQYWVGYRYFEIGDLIADGAGILAYTLLRKKIRDLLDPIFARLG
jgi:VanZ family protein